jgi:hypothetical protein
MTKKAEKDAKKDKPRPKVKKETPKDLPARQQEGEDVTGGSVDNWRIQR